MVYYLNENDTNTQIVAGTSNSTWFITEGADVMVAGVAVQGNSNHTNRTFLLDGHLFALGSIGLQLGTAAGGGGSTVLVGAGGSIYGETLGASIQGGTLDLTNMGFVSGADALHISGTGNAVSNVGTIKGTSGYGLRSEGDNAMISNSGVIAGETEALHIEGASNLVNNSGDIFSLKTGFANYYGIRATSSIGLVNDGSIIGGTGVSIDTTAALSHVVNNGLIIGKVGAGLAMSSAGADIVKNFGTIHGLTAGLSFKSTSGTIENHGAISGSQAGVIIEDGAHLLNFGEITVTLGSKALVCNGNSPQTVENYGAVKGDIHLGTGADVFMMYDGTVVGNVAMSDPGLDAEGDGFGILGGTISGNIYGGDGNDVFTLAGGNVNGGIYGGDGNDIYTVNVEGMKIVENPAGGTDYINTSVSLRSMANVEQIVALGYNDIRVEGNDLDNIMMGNFGSSTIVGLAGDDMMYSGKGATAMDGGIGSDTADYSYYEVAGIVIDLKKGLCIGGVAGDPDLKVIDRLVSIENATGSDFDDRLIGNTAGNVLAGGEGNDRLFGGRGSDILAGGDGADVFLFRTGCGKDSIYDFVGGEDRIDLSGWKAVTSFADLKAHHLTVSGDDIVITAGADRLVIAYTSKAELGASDFIF